MGGYFSSSKRKGEDESDSGVKRPKLNGKDMGVVKSKEYQIVYDVGPIRVEDLPPHIRSMFVLKRTG